MTLIPTPGDARSDDLAAEQDYIDRAYGCLDQMHQRAVRLRALGYMGGNVHAEVGLTPEMSGYWDLHQKLRVDALADDRGPLCFGRIDRRSGDRLYVGRRHVEDAEGAEIVTDWRAPVAASFYRATVVDHMGLERRRRFLLDGRQLVDLIDEDLEHPGERDTGAYVPDPLLAEIGRARTGEMRDIVATIQAEQDVIIRSPLERCIIVQGGPGTGKTAVGLHRAAFLLYEHRQELERLRLLIIGPNRIFLRYISQVLPSLGETASVQVTLEGLVGARYRSGLEEPATTARLKGDPRMAEVIRRATRSFIRSEPTDLVVDTAYGRVVLPGGEVARLVAASLERTRSLKDSRSVLKEHLVGLAWKVQAAKPGTDVSHREVFESAFRSAPGFRTGLDRLWPALSPPAVLRRLFGNRATLVRCTEGLFGSEEAALLARKPARRLSEERWSRADLALLDEAEHLIDMSTQSYGHVVVDEAQDLSAMELRLIARRARQGSMTILGDLAQATMPGAQSSWEAATEHLGAAEVHIDELSVGYRVPASIMSFADRLLPRIAPSLKPTYSVRDTGLAPQLEPTAEDNRAHRTATLTAELLEQWASVAVVTPVALKAGVCAALSALGLPFLDAEARAAIGDHVTVLSPPATKGLEFDAVVVVEPARIVEDYPHGLRLLYVVLTRAVQHLCIVHSDPLPDPLESVSC